MKSLNNKTLEVLDMCLAGESPEVKAKVYQIIQVSELDPSDPMFLVLALTGQMRVLLETAPSELAELMNEYKSQTESSIESIQQAIGELSSTQERQARVIRGNLESVSEGFADGIKEVGMATVSAISEANKETLSQATAAAREAAQLREEIALLRQGVRQERETWTKQIQVLMDKVSEPIESLKYTTQLASLTKREVEKFQEKAIWMQVFQWFTPLTALAVTAGAGFVCGLAVMLFKYNNDQNTLGRNLVEWNIDRIIKCQQSKKHQCNLWLVTPPEQR
ncbi:DUF6753 family protein [Nostoc sp. FACHB-190]|uniref:DUF6753 family protein n=1 Tax=Nostoc sp. FACHB-190 TaxID=2692838 RepID=UPI00168349DF|nr:DUF6753 family protein [Nostoc sp. FACHB-190]MBD2303788.1 hypothetical protein [Nostoc sp. FACHB-190]